MPIIEVTLIEGRSPEKLRALITALTDAAVQSVDAPKDSVRVILREVPPTHFAAADVTAAEKRVLASTPEPAPNNGTEPSHTIETEGS